MFRKNLKIRTLRFKTERIYTGIRVRRAATIHIRNKVNGYGAEKYPIERVCSGILEILTCGIADFIILKVVYPTSNGKIKQKTGFSSPQILNGYAPEYVVQYPSDFHVNRNLKVFGGNFAGLWSWKVFPACVGLTS